MGTRDTRVDSRTTLRDVRISHAVMCIVILLLPLYFSLFSTIRLRGPDHIPSTPTGAVSAITGAAVSGEPACPTFPAGAGIGGGCRLVSTTNVPAAVPMECITGSGCMLRVVANTPLASTYAGADIVSGNAKRTAEVLYNQDPSSNLVSLQGYLSGTSYQNTIFYTSPYTLNQYSFYLTSESSGALSPYSWVPISNLVLQGGSNTLDSIRFRMMNPASSVYNAYTTDHGCQLSIDSSLESDPRKLTVQPVPYVLQPASSCELYVCT